MRLKDLMETINWVYEIPSLFGPYIFVLFGKDASDMN